MRKNLLFLLFSLILVACAPHGKKANAKLTDDAGNAANFEKPVRKAVSLAPNLTEIIYFIGAEKQLAANTLYCNYPPEAKKKPKIGDLLNVDFERLVQINPDVILMTIEGNRKSQYEKIKALKFPVFVSNPRNFDGILKTIRDFGVIFGKEKTAAEKAEKLRRKFAELKKRSGKYKNKSALFLIAVKPLMAAGEKTFINEYLSACGLKNAVAESGLSYPVINSEELLKLDPDFIILPENQKELFDEFIGNNEILKNLRAAANGNVIFVNPDLYFRPGPRFVNALEDLTNRLAK